GSPLDFFRYNPSQGPIFWAPPRAKPQPRPRPARQRFIEDEEEVVRPRRAIVRPIPASPEVAVPQEPAAPPEPAPPPSIFVHVIGDSLAELLAAGLKDRLQETSKAVAVLKKARSSSGLVRDDYHDWGKAVTELLAGSERVDLLVVMMGSNDRQPLRDETGSHEFRSDRWRELYEQRIDALLEKAREKRVQVQWVGNPVMQGARFTADMIFLNDIVRSRVSRSGQAFTDIWEAFLGTEGGYSPIGPDMNGQQMRLRTADGVHFTKAGIAKLAFFAARDVEHLLRKEGDRPTIAALPSDISELVKRDAPVEERGFSIPLPGALEALPLIPEKPAAGPILELTAAPLAADGKLLQARPVSLPAGPALMVEQALAYGRPPQPKPGRADDFAWTTPPTAAIPRRVQ
ncbi:MAG: SGNH/GDSL hydrolase family protein, partial [Beijerinckiaceae bacterium]